MHIEFNIDLAEYTTFGLHAKAACLATYDDVDELKSLLSNSALPRPFKHIGEGSNLLFTNDFNGTILKCNNREASFIIEGNGMVSLQAAAGMSMDSLCTECCRKGLWGLENLSGIPGQVGAAAVQNVGAYGVEAGDLITEATVLDVTTCEIMTLTSVDMRFGYRDSIFKHPDNRGRYIVLSVTFKLSTTPTPRLGYAHLRSLLPEDLSATAPMDVRDAIISMRDAKLPPLSLHGSAGSFFKNPVISPGHFLAIKQQDEETEIPHYELTDGGIKIPAAWLIDRCGLKGTTQGGAAVWHKQPLVIINQNGRATPEDILKLEQMIISEVKSRFGITLSPEVEHVE